MTGYYMITNTAIDKLNAERVRVGAPKLARYPGMDAAAQDWADEMARADVVAHRPILAPYLGEIVASGAHDATTAVRLWQSSPAHWTIAVNPAYDKVGVGYNNGYWVMVFS
jgi:uncharacterized protein YkwD